MEKKKLINIKYAQINELKIYLSQTDYHNDKREDDQQKGINPTYQTPMGVLMERDNARANINALEQEISTLEQELEEEQPYEATLVDP